MDKMNWSAFLLGKMRPVIDELKKFNELKAIGIYGSVGAGWADKWSDDIDIVCFCSNVPNYNKRQKMLLKLGAKPSKCWGTADLFEFAGVNHCSIQYKTVSEIDFKVRELITKAAQWHERELAIYFNALRILYDPSGLIRKWNRRLVKYPRLLRDNNLEKISTVLSGLEQIKKGLQRHDWFQVDMGLQNCTDNLLIPLYALNRKYFATPKWIFKEATRFRTVPKGLLDKLKGMAALNSREQIALKARMIFNAFRLLYPACKRANPKLTVRSIAEAEADVREVERLVKRRVIDSGMIPKALSCVNAIRGGVKKAHILNASVPHALLLEIFTDKGIGTEIVK